MKKLTEKQMFWAGGVLLLIIAAAIFWGDIKRLISKAKYKAMAPDPSKIDKTKLLGIGDKGPEVAYLQNLIQQDGGDLGRWGIDEIFGPQTLSALMEVKGVDEISIATYEMQSRIESTSQNTGIGGNLMN